MKLAQIICIAACALLIFSACGQKPLLEDVSVSPTTITPNADGQTDLAKIEFMLNRNATVAITLLDEDGYQYTFRPPRPLSLNDDPYQVYFGGVVDSFLLPGEETLPFTITKRMLADGVYTWEILATTDDETATATGTLTIQDADTQLPAIRGFSISPKIFSPNQDGIDDRVRVNLTLDKAVEELRVYLLGADGIQRPLPEDQKLADYNEPGWHTYDYDGGIDSGAEPPPDGIYAVIAETRDAMSQRVTVSDTL